MWWAVLANVLGNIIGGSKKGDQGAIGQALNGLSAGNQEPQQVQPPGLAPPPEAPPEEAGRGDKTLAEMLAELYGNQGGPGAGQ